MIGAGGAEGAMDASNILKPSLARGELQLIGATTISEYRKYIEKDAALERRFQPITVEEPDSAQSIQILEGLKGKYESHHHVTIEPGALEAAVKLSERYISDRNLPDKAIDVLDEACSKANLNGFKVPDNLTKTEEILQSLMKEKEQAVAEGRFAEASMLNQEQQAVEKKLESIKKRFDKNQASHQICVTEQQIAEVVSVWTKIPVQKLGESESARLRKLEQTLQKRVIGQEEAVTAVAKAVKRGRVGLKSPNRPIGSFLFLGPMCYRYFGGKSIAWSEEVSRFLFLYLVYFAASLAASKNLHIRVTAQLKLLPKLGQMLLLLTTDIIWLVFCIIVVNVGTDFIISMSDRPMVSGALMLDMRYVYAAVPIAFTLQAVRLVERWWRIFTKRDPLVVPSEEVF